MSVPTFLSVSGSPVTSSGTLAVSLSGVPLPVLNGGTGGANETDARNELGAACKSCTETLTGNKTFSGTVTLSSVSGTATSVIGRSSTGQVVGVTLGNGLSLSSGTLSAGGDYARYTGTSATIPATVKYVDVHNNGTVTLTLPDAASYTGKEIVIKNSITSLVRSASSNIISFTVGTTPTVTTILSGTGTEAKFAVLVSDGTYWRILQAN
jgi:hypothetical protein